jgi:hypothetical protein
LGESDDARQLLLRLAPGKDIGCDDDDPDRVTLVLCNSRGLLAFTCKYFLYD